MEVLNKKVSKISSQQSGPFSTGAGVGINRHVDMIINQSYGVVSLKDSFIQIRTTILPADDAGSLIVPYSIESTSTSFAPVRNTDVIRNCWMSCSNFGMLENIRRVNVLHKNLKEYEEGVSAKLSQGQTLYNLYDPSTGLYLPPFIEVHKDDGFESKLVDAHLRVKLSDLFELGSVDMLDLSKLGDLTIHIEFEDKNYFTVSSSEYSQMLNLDIQKKMKDISGVSAPTQLVGSYLYQSKPQVPFYQNMPISVDYTYDLSGVDTSGTLITTVSSLSILQQQDASGVVSDYQVTLTLADPLEVSDNNQYTNIIVNTLEALPIADYNFLTVDLAICSYLNAPQNMQQLDYVTFTTEEYTNGTINLSKIFELEAECTAVLVTFNINNSILSNYTDKFTYRMRVDNVDMYEYDIECNRGAVIEGTLNDNHEGLYYDALNKLLTQLGKPVKCLMPVLDNSLVITPTNSYTNEDSNKIVVLGTPTQLTPMTKLFQLTINNKDEAPSNIEEIILFKQVQKSLKL